jgi:hypothetical protein
MATEIEDKNFSALDTKPRNNALEALERVAQALTGHSAFRIDW